MLVRTDVDYAGMDRKGFAAQDDPTRPLAFIQFAAAAGCIDAFEDILGCDFFAFRAALKASAAESLARLRNVRRSIGFADFDGWFASPEDEIVFPTDDDDVFHPELAALADVPAHANLVVWEYAGIGFHPWGSRPGVHRFREPVLMSNNWGVRKSFLRTAMTPTEARRFLSDHGAAQDYMVRRCGLRPAKGWTGRFAVLLTELRHPSVHFVNASQSIQYLHPASLYLLSLTAQVAELRARLIELELDEALPLPEDLAWARPSFERYESLIGYLSQSRRARLRRG